MWHEAGGFARSASLDADFGERGTPAVAVMPETP
jgi:hypothetical protein